MYTRLIVNNIRYIPKKLELQQFHRMLHMAYERMFQKDWNGSPEEDLTRQYNKVSYRVGYISWTLSMSILVQVIGNPQGFFSSGLFSTSLFETFMQLIKYLKIYSNKTSE